MTPSWSTYVALGDAFTEGTGDPDARNLGQNLGWADRVADGLSLTRSGFIYANLASHGTSLAAITEEQLPRARAMRPELISICAGIDELHGGATAENTAARFAGIIEQLGETGATIVLLTTPTVHPYPRSAALEREIRIYNRHLRSIAKKAGAVLVDLRRVRGLLDRSMRTLDGLHFNSAGHDHIASTALWLLGVEPRRPAAPRRAPRWLSTREHTQPATAVKVRILYPGQS